jgi:hypothetical protein
MKTLVLAASLLLSTAAGFSNPSYAASHIQQSLNKQFILSDTNGKVRCAGTTQVIACVAYSPTPGVGLLHSHWRYTYISSQRAKVVHRISMDGSV